MCVYAYVCVCKYGVCPMCVFVCVCVCVSVCMVRVRECVCEGAYVCLIPDEKVINTLTSALDGRHGSVMPTLTVKNMVDFMKRDAKKFLSIDRELQKYKKK